MRRLVVVIVVAAIAIALAGTIAGVYVAFRAVDLARDVSGFDAGEGDSFYLASNLSEGLDELEEKLGPDARVEIKIEQRSLKVLSSGRSVVVTAGGTAIAIPLPGARLGGPRLRQVDPHAVEQISRSVSERAGVDLQEIEYFANLGGDSHPRWGVYLESGERWEAPFDGGRVRRAF